VTPGDAVGFDLDGTLSDHQGSARSAVVHFFRSFDVVASESTLASWFVAEEEHDERWRSGDISSPEQRRQRLRSVLPPLGVDVPPGDVEIDALFSEYLRAYESAALERDGKNTDGSAYYSHELDLDRRAVTSPNRSARPGRSIWAEAGYCLARVD
jgi:phosphoglycolate phosphatase-like HAD superfamily hydrolase